MKHHLAGIRPHRVAILLGIATTALMLTACQVTVPSPVDTKSQTPTSTPTYAQPTIVPGHDAAAVAAADMTWDAGRNLSINVPVGFSDQVTKVSVVDNVTPPPAWTPVRVNQSGWTEYKHVNGCLLNTWQTVNQKGLAVPGDDRGSSAALYKYLQPGILPEALKDIYLPWRADASKPGPKIVLLGSRSASGAKPGLIYAVRLFAQAGTGLAVSLSCKDPGQLDPTWASIQAKLAVNPPTE